MPRFALAAFLAAALPATTPALAQDLASAASDALSAVTDAAEDTLLVGDIIGQDIAGPGGETLGTVENLVAIPGGRLVGIVVAPEDGDRLVLPYQMLKIDTAAETTGLSLPVTLADARAMEAVGKLTEAALP